MTTGVFELPHLDEAPHIPPKEFLVEGRERAKGCLLQGFVKDSYCPSSLINERVGGQGGH